MIVSWMTTNRCNLTCRHCYQNAAPDACANELTTAEARTLIDQIAVAGFRIMILSGSTLPSASSPAASPSCARTSTSS